MYFMSSGRDAFGHKQIKKAVRLHQMCDRWKRSQFHGCHECLAKNAACSHFMNKAGGGGISCEHGKHQNSIYLVSKLSICDRILHFSSIQE